MNDLISDPIAHGAVEVVVHHASGCRCKPTTEDIEIVVQAITTDHCISCGGTLKPKEVSMMCFCVAPGKPFESDWAGNIKCLEPYVVVMIEDERRLVHEACAKKALARIHRRGHL